MAKRLISSAMNRSTARFSTLLKDVLVSVSGAAVMLLGILVALSQVGVSLGPALAGLGVAGFIMGFALQDTLGNFAAGGMILFYQPYDVDDFVEVAGAIGLVKKMTLVSTTINTFDNQTLIIPNSKIWGDVIKNVTAQRTRRVDLEFGISYGDDIDKAERILKEIVESHDKVLAEPAPNIRLHKLGESSVNFVVRPWTKTPDYWEVYWDITREVKVRFDRDGISIPFPQRDVHIHQQDTRVEPGRVT
jgi:small conductance mechanosensitive channel